MVAGLASSDDTRVHADYGDLRLRSRTKLEHTNPLRACWPLLPPSQMPYLHVSDGKLGARLQNRRWQLLYTL